MIGFLILYSLTQGSAYHWDIMMTGFLIFVSFDSRDSIPLGHDGDCFLIFVPFDSRDSVPLGHDGDWLLECDAFPGLPALDARHPPPLSTTCQESASANTLFIT